MALMTCMEDAAKESESSDPLARGYRLHSRSTAEIVEKVENLLSRLNRRGMKFRGRKTKLEPFINVLVVEFLKLPPQQQDAMMLRLIPRFEAALVECGGIYSDPSPGGGSKAAEPGVARDRAPEGSPPRRTKGA